jgi:hypothetical protein
MKKPRESKRMSDDAVKERTGKTWAEWFKILDKAGAKKLPHKEISSYLKKEQGVGPWWCQMVAVAYEHERGIREKYQKCDGEFSASGSRTLNVPLSLAYEAWVNEESRRGWLGTSDLEISTATPSKSIRGKWGKGSSRLSVNFYGKGAKKCQVAVDHMKLNSSKECANMKTFWFDALNRLQIRLEG